MSGRAFLDAAAKMITGHGWSDDGFLKTSAEERTALRVVVTIAKMFAKSPSASPEPGFRSSPLSETERLVLARLDAATCSLGSRDEAKAKAVMLVTEHRRRYLASETEGGRDRWAAQLVGDLSRYCDPIFDKLTNDAVAAAFSKRRWGATRIVAEFAVKVGYETITRRHRNIDHVADAVSQAYARTRPRR